MTPRAAVLRPGDWVRYDGGDHQVIALAGTSVRLRSEHGAEAVLLVAYLIASPEFAVIDGAPAPSVEPFGLLEGLPVKVLEEAREWERHIVEVETGLPPNPLQPHAVRDDLRRIPVTLVRHLAHDGPSGCVSTPRSSASAAPLTNLTVPSGGVLVMEAAHAATVARLTPAPPQLTSGATAVLFA